MKRLFLILIGCMVLACSKDANEESPFIEEETPGYISEADAVTPEYGESYRIRWITPATWTCSYIEGKVNDLTKGDALPRHCMKVLREGTTTSFILSGIPASPDSIKYLISSAEKKIDIYIGKCEAFTDGEKYNLELYEVTKYNFYDIMLDISGIEDGLYAITFYYSFLPENCSNYISESKTVELNLISEKENIIDLPFFAEFENRNYQSYDNADNYWHSGGMAYTFGKTIGGGYSKFGIIFDTAMSWPGGPRHAVDFTLSGDTLNIETEAWMDYGPRGVCGVIRIPSASKNEIDLLLQYSVDETFMGAWRNCYYEDIPMKASFCYYLPVNPTGFGEGQYHFRMRSILHPELVWESDVKLVKGKTVTVNFPVNEPIWRPRP